MHRKMLFPGARRHRWPPVAVTKQRCLETSSTAFDGGVTTGSHTRSGTC